MKNMASTAGGVVIGNTVSQWKAKQQVSKVTAETAYQDAIKSGDIKKIKIINSNVQTTGKNGLYKNINSKFDKKINDSYEMIDFYKNRGMLNKANQIQKKLNNRILKENSYIEKRKEKIIANTEKMNQKNFNKIQKNIKKNK